MPHRRLTPHALELIAGRFKALAEPARLKILDALRNGEKSVSELAEDLDSSHANISKHLSVLFAGGFVKRRKQGLSVFYRLADKTVFKLCDVMCGRIEAELTVHRRTLRRR
ncbi:MAG TPA: metalloregulator ArsR/SmtB family transcription factor [Longimicrobiales bacterium]